MQTNTTPDTLRRDLAILSAELSDLQAALAQPDRYSDEDRQLLDRVRREMLQRRTHHHDLLAKLSAAPLLSERGAARPASGRANRPLHHSKNAGAGA